MTWTSSPTTTHSRRRKNRSALATKPKIVMTNKKTAQTQTCKNTSNDKKKNKEVRGTSGAKEEAERQGK